MDWTAWWWMGYSERELKLEAGEGASLWGDMMMYRGQLDGFYIDKETEEKRVDRRDKEQVRKRRGDERSGYSSGSYGRLLRTVPVLNNSQAGALARVGVQLMVRSEKR